MPGSNRKKSKSKCKSTPSSSSSFSSPSSRADNVSQKDLEAIADALLKEKLHAHLVSFSNATSYRANALRVMGEEKMRKALPLLSDVMSSPLEERKLKRMLLLLLKDVMLQTYSRQELDSVVESEERFRMHREVKIIAEIVWKNVCGFVNLPECTEYDYAMTVLECQREFGKDGFRRHLNIVQSAIGLLMADHAEVANVHDAALLLLAVNFPRIEPISGNVCLESIAPDEEGNDAPLAASRRELGRLSLTCITSIDMFEIVTLVPIDCAFCECDGLCDEFDLRSCTPIGSLNGDRVLRWVDSQHEEAHPPITPEQAEDICYQANFHVEFHLGSKITVAGCPSPMLRDVPDKLGHVLVAERDVGKGCNAMIVPMCDGAVLAVVALKGLSVGERIVLWDAT